MRTGVPSFYLRAHQTDKCQQAIHVVALKNAIIAEPVLAAPRFDRQFRVNTDAAQTEGLGGIRAQIDDYKREHVVAYYGRRFYQRESMVKLRHRNNVGPARNENYVSPGVRCMQSCA